MSDNEFDPALYRLQAAFGAAQMLAEESREIRDACRTKDPALQYLWARAAISLIGRFRRCTEEISAALPQLSKGAKRCRVAEVQRHSAFHATLDIASVTVKHLYSAVNASQNTGSWPSDSRVPRPIEVDAMLDALEPWAQRTAEWYMLSLKAPEDHEAASAMAELERAGVFSPHLTPFVRKAFHRKHRLGSPAQWHELVSQLQHEFEVAFPKSGPTEPDGFIWKNRRAKLPRQQWLLLNALWNKPGHTADIESVATEVWGHDCTQGDSALKSLLHRTNNSLCKADIAVTVAQKGAHLSLSVH